MAIYGIQQASLATGEMVPAELWPIAIAMGAFRVLPAVVLGGRVRREPREAGTRSGPAPGLGEPVTGAATSVVTRQIRWLSAVVYEAGGKRPPRERVVNGLEDAVRGDMAGSSAMVVAQPVFSESSAEHAFMISARTGWDRGGYLGSDSTVELARISITKQDAEGGSTAKEFYSCEK